MSSPAAPRTRPETRRAPLSPERMLEVAMRVADDVGLQATSMRRLAEELGVTPMALYKHVANRGDLVDRMVDALVARFEVPDPALPWDRALRVRLLSAHDVVTRHRWARAAFETRTSASPAVLAHMDALMGDLFAGGLSEDLVHHTMHALSTRMWGFTRDIMPTPEVPGEPAAREEFFAEQARRYPNIIRMATGATGTGGGCDSRAEFAFALDLLLDSVARRHAEGWAP